MNLSLPLSGEHKVRIGSHLWTLRFVEEVEGDSDETVHGLCDCTTRTITVCNQGGDSWVLSTLIHEVMHAIERTYEIRIRHQDLNLFSDILASVLLDNWSHIECNE